MFGGLKWPNRVEPNFSVGVRSDCLCVPLIYMVHCVLFLLVLYGMVLYGLSGTVWYGIVRYGTVWYGMVWYGTVWYDTVSSPSPPLMSSQLPGAEGGVVGQAAGTHR